VDNPDAPAGTVLSYSLAEFRQALKYPKPIALVARAMRQQA